MPNQRAILKIGLAVTDANRLLVVKKWGTPTYILPGGKPEEGEDDFDALKRELEEELGCDFDPDTLEFLGSFSDIAADLVDTIVTVRLYAARLIGQPCPRSEIEKIDWVRPASDLNARLAPSIQNKIVPFLYERGHLAKA